MKVNKKSSKTKNISLALQGGGSHGAFTWGVLDRFLEDDSINITSISATSAGAMNAAVMSYGFAKGGKKLAKELLESFWKKVSFISSLSPMQPSFFEKIIGINNTNNNTFVQAADAMRHFFSPYQLNFLDVNPLKDVLNEIIDFEELKDINKIKLFINATNVKTGRMKIFTNGDISDKTLLASACLPYITQAVTIDDQKYWDGGFSGNPSLSPLINDTDCSDIVVVQIVPFNIDETPVNIPDIIDRVNEISFNNALIKEIEKIESINGLLDENKSMHSKKYRKVSLHLIGNEEIFTSLTRASKLNADLQFLTYLRDAGRQTADEWLKKNFENLGNKTTLSVNQ